MAKVYKSDVDPDEFIRSFREEPSGVSTLKKRERITEQETLDDRGMPLPEPSNHAAPLANPSSAQTDIEQLFVQQFVRNMTHMRPNTKYLMVEVSPEFIRKIRRILSYENGPACSVKAYVNNVLAEHFKEYGEIINKRL